MSSIGLIAAAIGTLSMLMSEPKAKSNAIEDTHSMFVLSLVTYTVVTLHYILTSGSDFEPRALGPSRAMKLR